MHQPIHSSETSKIFRWKGESKRAQLFHSVSVLILFLTEVWAFCSSIETLGQCKEHSTLQRKDFCTLEISSNIHLQYSLALKLVYLQLSFFFFFPCIYSFGLKPIFNPTNFSPKNSPYKNSKKAQALGYPEASEMTSYYQNDLMSQNSFSKTKANWSKITDVILALQIYKNNIVEIHFYTFPPPKITEMLINLQ